MEPRDGLLDELTEELAALVPRAPAGARREAAALWVNALTGEFRTEQALRQVVISRATMMLRRWYPDTPTEGSAWAGPERRAGED